VDLVLLARGGVLGFSIAAVVGPALAAPGERGVRPGHPGFRRPVAGLGGTFDL